MTYNLFKMTYFDKWSDIIPPVRGPQGVTSVWFISLFLCATLTAPDPPCVPYNGDISDLWSLFYCAVWGVWLTWSVTVWWYDSGIGTITVAQRIFFLVIKNLVFYWKLVIFMRWSFINFVFGINSAPTTVKLLFDRFYQLWVCFVCNGPSLRVNLN